MSKRSADTERIGDEDGFRSTAPSGEPQTQRATAAQLAARKMARPRQGRRPGAQARPLTPQASPLSQSFPAPSWGTNPSASSASMQQPSGSFTFGQQPGGFSSSPNSAGSNPSFPSFGGQNNDSNQQFTAPSSAGFNFAAPPTTSNPFAGMNQQSQQPTFTSGFSGSIFNLPPQTPAAPEQPSERPPSEMRTPSHWMKNIPEAYQERDPQSFFVPNAPFKWGQPDPPQQEQSLQATSNTEVSAAAQQVAQPSSAHPFTQNSPQKQSTNDIFAHLQQPSSSSPNPFAQQPARQFQTTNIFGQHPASSPSQPSQPASTFFGQPSTSQDSSSTNIFSKPAISPTKDGDRMATTPDTSPQASNERAHLGPFASVSASSMNALANGTAPAGPASSIFGSSFQPSAGGGLTNGKTPKESASSEDLQRNDNDQASNVSLGSPTKKPRGMTQPRAEPPQAEEEAPLQKDNPFSAIKFPAPNAQTATPPFSFSPSPILNQGASVARPQANGKTLALSAKPTATGSVFTQHSRGSREPGMPPQAPADFTEEQKRQLITGWRLKSLDVGMQSYLRYSTFDQNEIDCVIRFYERRKRAILDANGGPLPEIGNKRAAGSQGGLPSKKARLNETSTTVERQIQSLNQSAAGKSSPGKRKASEDLLENDDGTSSNGLKKSKTNDQVAYPSLPTSSTNSQTSKLFGNLVGKKSMETSSGNSNPAVNGHLPTEADPTDIAQSSNASPSQPGSFPKLQFSSPSASARPLFPNKDKPISAFGFGQEPTSTPLQSKTGNQNTVDQATSAQSGAPFKGFVPSPAKLSSNSIPSQGFFASERSQGNSATTASSTTPTIAQGSGGVQPTSNASSFSGASADAAKSVNAKRKADEFTEGEGDGGQASPQKSEEQRSKKQKAGEEPIDFTPSEKREASIFKTQATGGPTGFGHSVLARSSPPPTNASNIFGHLTQSTEQHDVDTSDFPDREDDEDTRESQQVTEQQNASSDASQTLKVADSGPSRSVSPVYNPFASATFDAPTKLAETQKPEGRSIFDRIEKDDKGQPVKTPDFGDGVLKTPSGQKTGSVFDQAKPASSTPFGVNAPSPGTNMFGTRSSDAGKETSSAAPTTNIFGTPSISNNTPVTNLFGGKGTGNSPGGDNTWKPQTPIKFGSASSAEAPSISFTSPSPAKTTFTGLFGAPKASTSSEPSGSSIFKTTDSSAKPAPLTFGFSAPVKETNDSLVPPSGTQSESTSRATSPGGSDNEGVGESSDAVHDQEITPQLDSAEASKAEADEDVVFAAMGKLHKFDNSGKDKATHKWVLQGTEQFRVLKHRDTKKTRMLMRLKNGRIILNAGLQTNLSYVHVPAKRVRFPVPANGKVETWMVSLGQDDDAKKLAGILEENKDY